MFLEADLRGFLDTATDRHVSVFLEFHFEEKDEIRETIRVLVQEEIAVPRRQEQEVYQSPQRGLAQVVSILFLVFWHADFRDDDIQAVHEQDWVELLGFIRVQLGE